MILPVLQTFVLHRGDTQSLALFTNKYTKFIFKKISSLFFKREQITLISPK